VEAITALESGDVEVAGIRIEQNWRASLERVNKRQANRG
jgi:hypothetical protein